MAELREPASRRVKTLLVLSAIAEQEGIDASPDAEIDAEVERSWRAIPTSRGCASTSPRAAVGHTCG